MKHFPKTLALFCLLVFCQCLSAQNRLPFDESGYQAVLQRSKTEHKPIFYMFYAEWCPHCQKMKSEVFTDPAVIDFLTRNYVCAWQDIEKGEGESLRKKLKIKFFPTFLFLDQNETLLYSINGEFKSENLIAEAQNALIPEKQLPYLKKQFYDDPGNADKCLAYIMILRKGAERTELSVPANLYLSTQTTQQLISPANWQIIANAVTDINSREFQYVLQHQKAFAAVASAARVQRKIVNIVAETVKPFTENLDTVNYKKARTALRSLGLKSADSLVFKSDMIIAENTGNWASYKNAALGSAEKYAWDNVRLLKEIGQNFVKHVDDVPSLESAIKWMRHTEELTASYDGYLILARLYQKINDKKSAIEFARKSKEMTAALGWSSKEADALFVELGIDK